MRMKRLLIAFLLIAVPGMAMALDRTPEPLRIGILRAPEGARFAYAEDLHRIIRESLRDELRSRGADAWLAEVTFDDLGRDAEPAADYYVELTGDAWTDDRGGIGVGGRHADIGLGVLVSGVAADIFVYDGRSLEMVARDSVARRNKALLPTGVGVGGRSLFAWIALPFERAQERRVARALAGEIAARVLAAVRER